MRAQHLNFGIESKIEEFYRAVKLANEKAAELKLKYYGLIKEEKKEESSNQVQITPSEAFSCNFLSGGKIEQTKAEALSLEVNCEKSKNFNENSKKVKVSSNPFRQKLRQTLNLN